MLLEGGLWPLISPAHGDTNCLRMLRGKPEDLASISPLTVQEDALNTQTVDTNTAAKTYTTEDLMTAQAAFPFTLNTTPEELPGAVWLAAVAYELHDDHGVALDEAVENIVENQAMALAHRAAGLSHVDVAEGAFSCRPQ